MRWTWGSRAVAVTCWALLVLPATVGCEKMRVQFEQWSQRRAEGKSASQPAAAAKAEPASETQPAPGAPETATSLLEQQNKVLQDQNFMLREDLKEFSARDKRFTDEINQLRFANSQLAEQVKALSGAQGERDDRKDQIETLTAEIQRLRKELADLRRKHEPAGPTGTGPTTRAQDAGAPERDAGPNP